MADKSQDQQPLEKTFELTMRFTVWMNDEILEPYADEDELDEDEKRALSAQRSLLKALLGSKRNVLDELIRKRVLEDADGAVDIYELKDRLLLRNIEEEHVLLEPVIDALPQEDRLFLLEAIEEGTFTDAAGEAIYSIGVELEDASLVEVETSDEDDLYTM